MSGSVEVQLPPRIQKHCFKLWQDGHYMHAAREAMVQVELALKEKGMVNEVQFDKKHKFGKVLIYSLFISGEKNKGIKLRVPLGDELQEDAMNYFGAVFTYYRNYLAHDGSKVDKDSALRVLVIASDLLGLIDASSLSYADLGGVDGLLKSRLFESKEQLLGVLETCSDYALPGHEADGLRDAIFYNCGALDQHLDAVFELDLVRYTSIIFHIPDFDDEEGGWLELTDLGRKVIDEIKHQKSDNPA